MRVWSILFVFFATGTLAMGQTQPATAPNSTGEQTPEAAQNLVLDAVRDLTSSEHLTIAMEVSERTEPILKPGDDAKYADQIFRAGDSAQTIEIRRPDRLKFTMTVPARLDDSARASPDLYFDGQVFSAVIPQPGRPPIRRAGPVRTPTVDRVLRQPAMFIAFLSPAASRLLTSDAEVYLATHGTEWRWLGGGHDNLGAMNRVAFRLPRQEDDERLVDWELWVTRTTPPRISRAILRQEAKHAITKETSDSKGKSRYETLAEFQVRRTEETRFSKYDSDTQLDDNTFVRPTGDYQKSPQWDR